MLIFACISNILNAEEELSYESWITFLRKEKSRSKLIESTEDKEFYVALFGEKQLTAACFWFRTKPNGVIRDSVLIKLKNGQILDWSKNADDIPIKREINSTVSIFYAGYSGNLSLADIDSISIQVLAEDEFREVELTYNFIPKNGSHASSKSIKIVNKIDMLIDKS